MLSILRYNEQLKDDWDCIVTNSKNGTFLHSRDYIGYHGDRFSDQSVLFYYNSRAIAVFPSSSHELSVVSHGGLTYGGLVYGKEVSATVVLCMFECLANFYREAGYHKIFYKAVPKAFHSYPAEEDLYCLYRVGAKLYRRDLSSVIDIGNRPKLSDSRKSCARKALKAGAQFLEISDFTGFHLLLASALKKFNTSPVHSIDDLVLLKSRFPSNIRLFGILLYDDLLAATLVFDIGDIVHTQYMASSTKGRALCALDFLLANLIEDTFSNKKYFSFGISTEKDGMILNEGLLRVKESYGGRGITHDHYEWDLLK